MFYTITVLDSAMMFFRVVHHVEGPVDAPVLRKNVLNRQMSSQDVPVFGFVRPLCLFECLKDHTHPGAGQQPIEGEVYYRVA